jgi:hypothetical protein
MINFFGGRTMTHFESNSMSQIQRSQMERVLDDLERLNQTIKQAVEAGLTIEIIRAARHHCGGGNWGDVMSPKFLAKG